MTSGNYDTLQGVTLTQHNTHVTTGIFENPESLECYEDGDIVITWKDGSTQTISLTTGWVHPINCKSLSISSGTWNIGLKSE